MKATATASLKQRAAVAREHGEDSGATARMIAPAVREHKEDSKANTPVFGLAALAVSGEHLAQ